MEKEELVVEMLPNVRLTEERRVRILGLTYAWENLFKVIDGPNCPVGSVTLHPLSFAPQRFGHSSVGRRMSYLEASVPLCSHVFKSTEEHSSHLGSTNPAAGSQDFLGVVGTLGGNHAHRSRLVVGRASTRIPALVGIQMFKDERIKHNDDTRFLETRSNVDKR